MTGSPDTLRVLDLPDTVFDLDSPSGRALMAGVTEDMVRKACREMGIPYVPALTTAPETQPDLFGDYSHAA